MFVFQWCTVRPVVFTLGVILVEVSTLLLIACGGPSLALSLKVGPILQAY